MKKVLIFIVALISIVSYSANAMENEEYEVIAVLHVRSGKILVHDTLFGNSIIYTERKALNYAVSRIPEKFVDTSEKYLIYNRYHADEEEPRHYFYWLKCKYKDFYGRPRWSYSDISDEALKSIKETNE